MTCDVRLNSQRVMGTRTTVRALGMSTLHTLCVQENGESRRARRKMALPLWLNSTLGLLQHAGHANRTQFGLGRGNKSMLETLPTLDVRHLQPWQSDQAQAIWHDFQDRTFESIPRCALDPARTELDRRITTDLLALLNEARDTVTRPRELRATDPSIHGSKLPVLADD